MPIPQEIPYGQDPITVIIRWRDSDRRVFDKLNEISFDEAWNEITQLEIDVVFQRVSETEHRLVVPLYEGHLELVVKFHKPTMTYQVVVLQTKKSAYREEFRLPTEDFIEEACVLRFIDMEEGGRGNLGSGEFEELYNRVELLPIASAIHTDSQKVIWSKYIAAQRAILDSLEKPFPVHWPPKVKEEGKKITLEFLLQHELLGEFRQLEGHLKRQHVITKVDVDGAVWLTWDQIRVLDAVLVREFGERLERSAWIRAALYLSPRRNERIVQNLLGRSEGAFWEKFKIELAILNLTDAFSEKHKMLFLSFQSLEELQEQLGIIQNLRMVNFSDPPFEDRFKFKVELNVIAKKTEIELFTEKLKLLRGAEFGIDVKKEGQRRPNFQFLGKLNMRESNAQRLVLDLPNHWKDEKKTAEDVLQFLEEHRLLKGDIKANLTGDSAKMSWLEQAVQKIIAPKLTPNGTPINRMLGEFVFDSAKARPIYDERKLKAGSEHYQLVRNNELLQLNEPQRQAVLASLHCPDLALLQGPPGTGKTTVIAEIIWQIISQDVKHKVLLTSETNLAVDNALDRLLNVKGVTEKLARYVTIIKPLRFGRMGKMDEEGAKYSIDRIKKWVNPDYKPPQEMATALDANEDEGDDVKKNSTENNAVRDWMIRIADRAKNNDPRYAIALKDWSKDLAMPSPEIKQVFTDKYFKYANVVGSTCSSAGGPSFMWGFAEAFLGDETEGLRKMNGKAQRTPFGNQFDADLRGFPIPKVLLDEFYRLRQHYYQDQQAAKRYFDEKSELNTERTAVAFESLRTIDGKPLQAVDDTGRLESYQLLTTFGREQIAAYIEPKVVFDTVIMDEASKATPPELLVPLCFGKRVIVIGDHRQLPPMINDKDFREALIEAGAPKLAEEIDPAFTETSQFERMILNPKVHPTVISRCNIQYRMHPDINAVIRQFYLEEGGLEPAAELIQHADSMDLKNNFSRHHGLFLPGFIEPDTHTIWVNVQTPEAKVGTSTTNQGEVDAIRLVIQLLQKASGFKEFQDHWDKAVKDEFKRQQEQQIGVISFYGAQMNLIKRSLKGMDVPLKINTVDRFQGMERNIILVSTVRSHLQEGFGGQIHPNRDSGFAKSPNRLNVALSRARRLLIVVGNKAFFERVKDSQKRPLYKNAIEEIRKHGMVIDFEKLKGLAE